MNDPLITVLAHARVPSPESAEEIDPSLVVGIGLRDALTKVWPTDAHLTAYEPVELAALDAGGNETGDTIPVRLTRSAIAEGISPRMVAMIGDVDPPGHTATPEWRADVEGRLDASGLAWYSTRNGYRVVATIDDPIVLSSVADEARWSDLYLNWREFLLEDGIEIDPACKDWTRIYRLPNVRREGKPVRSDVRGIEAMPSLPLALGDTTRAPAATRADTSSPDDARMRRAQHIAERMPASISGDGGDAALFDAANEIATQLGEDAAAIESVLADTFNPRCDPPWPPAKLRREAERAASRQATPEARHMRRADERHDRANDNGTEGAASRADDNPAILVSRTDAAHILLWDGDDRGHRPVALGTLRNRIQELGLYIRLTDDKGRKIDPRTLIEEHGRTFGTAIYDYSQSYSTYDAEHDRVVVGYPMTQIAPREDPGVAAWLHALAGDEYPRLEAWIASCSQKHIGQLAAALVLVGPAGVGKSLFAGAVSSLWGQPKPAPASVLIERFNSLLAQCPIVFDDEAILFGSRELSTKRFRDLAQERQRNVEPKGREKFIVRGTLRLIIATNEPVLSFTDVSGYNAVRAVADRLCVIDVGPRTDACLTTLAGLRPDTNADDVDVDRIVSHLAWIGATVALAPERFIGGGSVSSTAPVLAGHVQDNAVVFETLITWIDGGPDSPWYAIEGELCIDTTRLAAELSLRGGWDLPRVRAALEPFNAGSMRPRSVAG